MRNLYLSATVLAAAPLLLAATDPMHEHGGAPAAACPHMENGETMHQHGEPGGMQNHQHPGSEGMPDHTMPQGEHTATDHDHHMQHGDHAGMDESQMAEHHGHDGADHADHHAMMHGDEACAAPKAQVKPK